MHKTSSLTYSIAITSKIDKLLAYSAVDISEITTDLSAGALVKVPVGNGVQTGVIIEIANHRPAELEDIKLKSIQFVFPKDYWLNESLLELAKWMATYYHQSLNRVLNTLLPSAFIKSSKSSFKSETLWQAIPSEEIHESLSQTPRQLALYQWIKARPMTTQQSILDAGFSRDLIKKLQQHLHLV